MRAMEESPYFREQMGEDPDGAEHEAEDEGVSAGQIVGQAVQVDVPVQ